MNGNTAQSLPATPPTNTLFYVIRVSSVAALGGLLFGYDTAVIAGAIGFLQIKFHLSPSMVGWVASSAIWGCVLGVVLAGKLSDQLGRKKALIATAFLFGISGIGSALPDDLTTFIMARFAGGVAIGAVSVLAPLYLSEIAPSSIRGRMVTLYQLAIVLGINLIYFVNMKIEATGTQEWNIEYGWRWMLGSETIPALLFLFLLFLVPESPRWLIAKNQNDKALAILKKMHGSLAAHAIQEEVKTTLHTQQGTWSELLLPHYRTPLIIGIVLALFSQITGINAIIYYAPEILKSTGIGTDSALTQTFIIGIVNSLFTLVALWLVDLKGRRILLIWGVSGMVICLLGTTVCFYFNWTTGPWLLIFILGYIASFASSLGPIPWIIISEIFPTQTRGIAMAIATLVLWLGVIAVTQLTPMLLQSAGGATLFFLFLLNSIFLLFFSWMKIPETKNLSLEAIEKGWTNR